MDVSLSNAIVNTSVLKKALNVQQASAATLLASVAQTPPPPVLATSGSVGTQLNTFA